MSTKFKKYLLLSFIFALINVIILVVFFVPRFNHSDTHEYINAIEYVLGNFQGDSSVYYRILKPMPILIGAFLSPVLGVGNSLIFQNLIFYFLSVFLVFILIYRFYQNERQAFYGTVLYTTAYPMLAYGLAPLTDLAGWFFYLASVLISLNFLKKPQLKTALLAGLIAGIGMLFKESLAAAPIFFASLVFITTKISFKEKLKYVIAFGAVFAFLPLISGILLYKFYSLSLLHWYGAVLDHPESSDGFYAYSFSRILIEIGRAFLFGWIFVLLGTLKEFAIKNTERIKILFVLLIPSLSFLLWPFPHNRIVYIAAPLLVLLGSFGLLRKYKNTKINISIELILLVFYISINYFFLIFLLRYGDFLRNIF